MIVKFINVGRNKANWEAECSIEEFNHDFMYKEAKKALMSDNINFHKKTARTGFITAGLRTVGHFELSEDVMK